MPRPDPHGSQYITVSLEALTHYKKSFSPMATPGTLNSSAINFSVLFYAYEDYNSETF
jgi:hypothetical protein